MEKNTQSRRDFMKQTSLIAGGLAAIPFGSEAGNFFNSSADDTIKVVLIGCGGSWHRRVLASHVVETKREARCDGGCIQGQVGFLL